MTELRIRKVDPAKSTQIVIFGRKSSGKSELARRYWDSWPYDRVGVDVTHDDIPDETVDPETRTVTPPFPSRWPADPERRRVSLRFAPDMGSDTYSDDLDRSLGLAYNHRRTLFVCHEMGEVFKSQQLGPYARRALNHGRHRDLSLCLCGPRPITVDPLVLAQADVIHIFDLRHPDDRERIAKEIDADRKDFDAAVHGLGKHEYLTFDAGTGLLVHCPALEGVPARRMPLPKGTST